MARPFSGWHLPLRICNHSMNGSLVSASASSRLYRTGLMRLSKLARMQGERIRKPWRLHSRLVALDPLSEQGAPAFDAPTFASRR
jgi:hypothetical protein